MRLPARLTPLFVISAALCFVSPAGAAAPWPEMRHDRLNTGFSPIVARYHGDRPWFFATGRGIFSTPVIGADGTVYVGSADTYFYAIAADGRLRWKVKTGGIIDAAAALAASGPRSGAATVTFGAGDDLLRRMTAPAAGPPRLLWRFRANRAPVGGQQVDWWEGPVAIGPNGDVYAGNTGGTAYVLDGRGRVVWEHTAGQSIWTEPAFGPNGVTYWGSLDLHAFALDARGRPLWSTFTPGYAISSPAIGSDGTVYEGSFDSKLYALDGLSGAVRWTFATSDHIYASPALGHDAGGHTNAIYIASADGSVYALSPAGRLLWRYDTGDPIRSSPVLGRVFRGDAVLYVGSSNGKLYALDAVTGRRRWSFDTTASAPALRDRNDLNASPALGRTGVVIAGEDGYVDYVPYDYCLHVRDARCSTDPAQEFGDTVKRVFVVTAGGTTLPGSRIIGVSPATVVNLRLVVRSRGRTVNAAILDPGRVVSVSPRFAFSVQESGDGHFLYVVPRGVLRPGTTYRVRVAGGYTDNGQQMGNFDPHGPVAGRFDQTIVVRTTGRSGPLPLVVGRRRVSAVTISRLAVPMPAFLPSVNQIGFDSYDWIASVVARTRSSVLMWVIGATRDARGVERVDPRSAFSFPLHGAHRGSSVALSSANVPLQFSFGPVPLARFVMRGSLSSGLSFRPGAALYSETVCASVPVYGPELFVTGICNPSGVLAASGTFLSRGYFGPAAARPAGLGLGTVALVRPTGAAAGSVRARLVGPRLPSAASHVVALLLTDAATGVPVVIDYRGSRSETADGRGRITAVRLTLPAGLRLPAHVRAYVMVDAFPLGSRLLWLGARLRPGLAARTLAVLGDFSDIDREIAQSPGSRPAPRTATLWPTPS